MKISGGVDMAKEFHGGDYQSCQRVKIPISSL